MNNEGGVEGTEGGVPGWSVEKLKPLPPILNIKIPTVNEKFVSFVSYSVCGRYGCCCCCELLPR